MTKEQDLAIQVARLTEKILSLEALIKKLEESPRVKSLENNQRWVVLAIGGVVLKVIADFVARG